MGGQNLQCPRAASWDSKPSEAFRGPADGDCSHEIKRHWLLTRKAMTNLDSSYDKPKKLRHYFADKSPSSESYGFSSSHVWSWTIKKAEHQRIYAFELWCWRRLLKVPGLQGDQARQL